MLPARRVGYPDPKRSSVFTSLPKGRSGQYTLFMAQATNFAYLSIIRWPDGYTVRDQVEALVEAVGMEPFLAQQRVVKGVPAIVHRFDESLMAEVMKPLKARRVLAFALPHRTLEALPTPVAAKRLIPAEDAPSPMYMCEAWRGNGVGFLTSDLFLIVRAQLRKTTKGEVQSDTYTELSYSPYAGVHPTTYTETYRNDKTKVTHIMDLYLRDGRRIRINGDKFNFDMLGKARGLTDNENIDKVACQIAEEAPGCLIDVGFEKFIAPIMLIRGLKSGLQRSDELRNDNPAFEFYTGWTYLLNRVRTARER